MALHTYDPQLRIKLAFTSIFDDLGVAVLTHDVNAKTLRLGTGYSLLDENGDPIGVGGPGGGISGTISATQVAFGAGADEIGGDAGFTFDPTTVSDDAYPTAFTVDRTILSVAAMQSFPGFVGSEFNLTTGVDGVAQIIGTSMITNAANDLSDSITVLQLQPAVAAIKTVPAVISLLISNTNVSGTVTDQYGIYVGNISGATNNYAIKTAAGDIVFGHLAGTGTRYVYCDDDGKLVAGAAV